MVYLNSTLKTSKIVVYARGNLSVEEKNDYVARVENIILDIQKSNNEFKNIYSISGNVSEQSEDSEDFIGSISEAFKIISVEPTSSANFCCVVLGESSDFI